MLPIVIVLSITITVLATVPYLVEVVRGNVKPRLATWFIWSLLAFIGASAAFVAHQIPAGALTLAAAFEAEWVVLAGWKKGDRRFEALDVLCLMGALGCLLLLIFLHSPTLAVLAVTLVDLIGTIPTLRHTWTKPYEETWLTYALFIPAEGLILFVANLHQPTSFIFPFYYLLQDVALAGLVVLSPHRRRPSAGVLVTPSPALVPAGAGYSRAMPGRIFSPGAIAVSGNPAAAREPAAPTPLTATSRPAFTSVASAMANPAAPFNFSVTVSGGPSSLTISGNLPPGLSFSARSGGTAVLSGRPAPGTEGAYPLAITAANSLGSVTQAFVLTVAHAPVLS